MTRAPITDDCGVAQALNVVGEWRTFLIVRNLFNGMRTFDALQSHLGISTSVLSARLKTLSEAGVIVKRPDPRDGRSHEYRLTEKGLDLYPILIALLQWGEKWTPNGKGLRLQLVDRETGQPIRTLAVTSQDGRTLGPRDVTPILGPGGNDHMRTLIARRNNRKGNT